MDGQVSRRRFLDWFLSTSAGVFLLSAFYPVARCQEKKRLKIGERSFASDFDRVVEGDDKVVEPWRFFQMGTVARVRENSGFRAVVFWHRACTAVLIV